MMLARRYMAETLGVAARRRCDICKLLTPFASSLERDLAVRAGEMYWRSDVAKPPRSNPNGLFD
jgi:hypothetical protein